MKRVDWERESLVFDELQEGVDYALNYSTMYSDCLIVLTTFTDLYRS